MVASNLVADYVGILIFQSVFGIAWANLVPVLIAIVISYVYLNRFYKFSIFSILKVGLEESRFLIKQVYQTVTKKQTI